MAPYGDLIERRILRTREFLIGTDRPTAEIALNVGFSSHGHLTFNFRKVTGGTPSRFRQTRS